MLGKRDLIGGCRERKKLMKGRRGMGHAHDKILFVAEGQGEEGVS